MELLPRPARKVCISDVASPVEPEVIDINAILFAGQSYLNNS